MESVSVNGKNITRNRVRPEAERGEGLKACPVDTGNVVRTRTLTSDQLTLKNYGTTFHSTIAIAW